MAYGQQQNSADTLRLEPLNPYRPFFRTRDRYGDPFSNFTTFSPLFLKNPKSFNTEIEIDTGRNYNILEKAGSLNYKIKFLNETIGNQKAGR